MCRRHVLFLNATETFGADVAVHASIALTLDRARFRVSAATNVREAPGASSKAAFAANPDVTVLPLDLGQPIGHRRGTARAKALLYNGRGVLSLVQLAAWCRRNRVDIVHVTERPRQTLFGIFVARLAGSACLVHAHTSIYPQEATPFAKLRLSRATAVVGVSRFTAESYRQLAGIPPEHVFAVHNAVDPDVFRPDIAAAGARAMRERLGLSDTARVIACVARLTRWKAQHVAIEAFAKIRERFPDARLVLPGLTGDAAPDGAGTYRDYLVRRAEALNVASFVSLPGFLHQSVMPEFFGAIDVLAHPSYEEPFGLVLVEAMASERPVIAVNGGGVPEIIRNEIDGLLVEAENSNAMADALARVLEDAALARRLGKSGRERVLEAFTPQVQAAAMAEVYDRVLDR